MGEYKQPFCSHHQTHHHLQFSFLLVRCSEGRAASPLQAPTSPLPAHTPSPDQWLSCRNPHLACSSGGQPTCPMGREGKSPRFPKWSSTHLSDIPASSPPRLLGCGGGGNSQSVSQVFWGCGTQRGRLTPIVRDSFWILDTSLCKFGGMGLDHIQ